MRLIALCSGMMVLVATSVVPAIGDEPKAAPARVEKRGEAIVACGQKIEVGTPVILWTDPGGYNAYGPKIPKPPAPDKKARSIGFGQRRHNLSEAQLDEIKANGWTLPLLREAVDQFVIHFDACGTSRKCFEVLHEERDLSVHFMLDLDGTIYQTLDLKEAAYHATKANGRSIGIEIANIGTFQPSEAKSPRVTRWYQPDAEGRTRITLPPSATVPTHPSGSEPLRPSRDQPVEGNVQGMDLAMYDLTPQQYDALIKLSAGLCRTFPKIACDAPRTDSGQTTTKIIPTDDYPRYQGILGHYHVQLNKNDPGPAFQWDRLIEGARAQLSAK